MKTKFIFLFFLSAICTILQLKAQDNEVQVGTYAGHNSKGSNNVYLGSFSGWSDNSLAVPVPTSSENTYNTFVGAFTGNVNVGKLNSFVGGYSGWESKGQHNTFMGYEAGKSNYGAYNTFMGKESGKTNTGVYNAALGLQSGLLNKGDYNVFSGYRAGNQNAGSRNISLGYAAGVSNVGSSNIILGAEAGGGNNGSFNIIIGEKAGMGNDGSANVMVGNQTGRGHINANFNTYLGHHAGEKNQLGNYNVFLGYQSGQYEVGSHKLYIASSTSNILLYGDFAKRKLAVGGRIDSDYTLHVLGTAFSSGNWVSSDRRYKTGERGIEKASEKIMALQGKSYEFSNNKNSSEARLAFAEGKQFGFIAQEMRQVLPELVREGTDGYLAINYDGVIPVLVEAFKELQAENQALREELQNLIQQFTEARHSTIVSGSSNMGACMLYQNQPNPFNNSTEIQYEVAADGKSVGLLVYDATGILRLQFLNLPPGKGKVNIQAGALSAGAYVYSLSVDGKVVASKQMFLAR